MVYTTAYVKYGLAKEFKDALATKKSASNLEARGNLTLPDQANTSGTLHDNQQIIRNDMPTHHGW